MQERIPSHVQQHLSAYLNILEIPKKETLESVGHQEKGELLLTDPEQLVSLNVINKNGKHDGGI